MRVLIQRVRQGCVRVNGEVTGSVNQGLVILVGVTHTDTKDTAMAMAKKVANLRIFADEMGKMNVSALDVNAGALVVSQFTLYADARKGRRPNYIQAASPEMAEAIVDDFIVALQDEGMTSVETGVFGAMMDVEIHNSGPVTIWLDSEELKK